MEPEQVDGQCPWCGLVEAHAPDCSLLKARLFCIRLERDHDLAALAEVYHPRQGALHEEYAARRAAIYAQYDAKVAELRAAV